MLSKRIIACLDVCDGKVVKGVQFKNHVVMGDILDLAQRYADEGIDELVFYDITASAHGRVVSKAWVKSVAKIIDIPFCVAGGIRSVADAEGILNDGADKISINSPALENPELITDISNAFGAQCVVVGIDSREENDGSYKVYKYTGDSNKTIAAKIDTLTWVQEVQKRGAGEIVLNCMNNDGVKNGYDIKQLQAVRSLCRVPLVASGGAGTVVHFNDVFKQARVDAALAASVFHTGLIPVKELKSYLKKQDIEVRL